MEGARARVLWSPVVVVAVTLLLAEAASVAASVTDVSGNWVSRGDGPGYVKVVISSIRGVVSTEYFDARLELSQSGVELHGTLDIWNNETSESWDAYGHVRVSEVLMYVLHDWGEIDYVMNVSGDLMTGTGVFIPGATVGVVHGTFDLERESWSETYGPALVTTLVTATVAAFIVISRRQKRGPVL